MRRYALLIEALIALTLTTTLLGALVFITVQLTSRSNKTDEALKTVVDACLTRKRLTQVLSEAWIGSKGGIFCSSNPGIVFTYNRGVDPNPLFSADVLARLYVEDKKLILGTWPNPIRFPEETPPHLSEVLATGVESWGVEFYNPPPMEGREEHSRIPYGWLDEWKQEWHELPLMVRIKLNDTSYTLTLYHANKLLIFPKKTS